MNGAHLHLAINHLPLFAILFALACFVLALWRPLLPVVRRAGLVLVVVGGLGAGASYFTGEPAEEVVEDMPGITDAVIHEHEESAEWAFIVCGAAAVLALGMLWRRRGQPIDRGTTLAGTALAVLAFAVLARTALLGGYIHHQELRPAGMAAEAGGGPAAPDVD